MKYLLRKERLRVSESGGVITLQAVAQCIQRLVLNWRKIRLSEYTVCVCDYIFPFSLLVNI